MRPATCVWNQIGPQFCLFAMKSIKKTSRRCYSFGAREKFDSFSLFYIADQKMPLLQLRRKWIHQIRTRHAIRCWCSRALSRTVEHPYTKRSSPRRTARCLAASWSKRHMRMCDRKCWSLCRHGPMHFARRTNIRQLRWDLRLGNWHVCLLKLVIGEKGERVYLMLPIYMARHTLA